MEAEAVLRKDGWKWVLRKACTPTFNFSMNVLLWFCMWLYILIGAAIFRAIENPTRQQVLATSAGQGEITYLQAIFFTEVYITTCGLGDIVPITDDGRGFMYVWAFFGCAFWLLMMTYEVTMLHNWVLFNLVLYPWWQARGKKDLEARKEHFNNEKMLTWPVVAAIVLVGLVIYFGIHLFGAGVLLALEPDLGNAPHTPYFPNTFGNAVYFTISASQTICLGNDYNPKTPEGMGFWLVWHPMALASSCFLFSTAAVMLLKWCNARLFSGIEKVVKGIYAKQFKLQKKKKKSKQGAVSGTADFL